MGGLPHSNVNENSGEGYFLRQRRTVRAWTTSPWTTKLRFLDIRDLHLHVVAAAIHGEVAIILTLAFLANNMGSASYTVRVRPSTGRWRWGGTDYRFRAAQIAGVSSGNF